eukprot:TRINITY_DN109770_c0_g1_i1.p1 TRINITY_DN109770_c0_g1~~TRINITY_DN109770_c0_g1_i1.p1  ORF type:complete len:288 (-),score=83.83 TRINITY_DN109770_c0_g1_i1:315-1178(-)
MDAVQQTPQKAVQYPLPLQTPSKSMQQPFNGKKRRADMNAKEIMARSAEKGFDDLRKAVKKDRQAIKKHFTDIQRLSREINNASKSHGKKAMKLEECFLSMLKKHVKACTTYRRENGYKLKEKQTVCLPGVDVELWTYLRETIEKAKNKGNSPNGDDGEDDSAEEADTAQDLQEQSMYAAQDEENHPSASKETRGAKQALQYCEENSVWLWNKKPQANDEVAFSNIKIGYAIAKEIFKKTNLEGGLFQGENSKKNRVASINFDYDGQQEQVKMEISLEDVSHEFVKK